MGRYFGQLEIKLPPWVNLGIAFLSFAFISVDLASAASQAQHDAGFATYKRELNALIEAKVPGWAKAFVPAFSDDDLHAISDPVVDAALAVPVPVGDATATCSGAFPKNMPYQDQYRLTVTRCTTIIENSSETSANRRSAHFERGRNLALLGEYNPAIEDFTAVLEIDPGDSDAYDKRASAYWQNGELVRAISDYSKEMQVAKEKYKHDRAVTSRGLVYADKEDYGHAIEDFSETIRLNPSDDLAYIFRANTYRDEGEYDRAIADYSEAMKSKPDELVYLSRGDAYRYEGNFDRAIADYSAAIEVSKSSRSYTYYIQRADAYYENGAFELAIADYDKAIQLDRDNDITGIPDTRRGNFYRDTGNYERAFQDYSNALQLGRDSLQSSFFFHSRGIAYLYSGSAAKAVADFNSANHINRADLDNALWIVITAWRTGGPDTLPQLSSSLNLNGWPAPLFLLLRGQRTPAEAMVAADNPAPHVRKSRICQANFFIGQWYLQRRSISEATQQFQAAAHDCPKTNSEWGAAKAELKMLGDGSHIATDLGAPSAPTSPPATPMPDLSTPLKFNWLTKSP